MSFQALFLRPKWDWWCTGVDFMQWKVLLWSFGPWLFFRQNSQLFSICKYHKGPILSSLSLDCKTVSVISYGFHRHATSWTPTSRRKRLRVWISVLLMYHQTKPRRTTQDSYSMSIILRRSLHLSALTTWWHLNLAHFPVLRMKIYLRKRAVSKWLDFAFLLNFLIMDSLPGRIKTPLR